MSKKHDLSLTSLVRVPTARAKLVAAMAAMPEEAFCYLLREALYEYPRLAKNAGLAPESRQAFAAIATLADAYVDRM